MEHEITAKRIFWDTASDRPAAGAPSAGLCLALGLGLGVAVGVVLFALAEGGPTALLRAFGHGRAALFFLNPLTFTAALFGGFSGCVAGALYSAVGGRIGAVASGVMTGLANPGLWIVLPGSVRYWLSRPVVCLCWTPFILGTAIALALDAWFRRHQAR